ncbi:hypothetical protein ZIOFF_035179 [Zingiber officinale]|uniref:Flavodoxin-like domain-containing protein n=1 Tax=Zingiber officinale TaxID=94328 RepID=A0A8J5G8G7_ZINOF|nr:hypothetical protein ZIOFF_035179 [Zingiber officinale]
MRPPPPSDVTATPSSPLHHPTKSHRLLVSAMPHTSSKPFPHSSHVEGARKPDFSHADADGRCIDHIVPSPRGTTIMSLLSSSSLPITTSSRRLRHPPTPTSPDTAPLFSLFLVSTPPLLVVASAVTSISRCCPPTSPPVASAYIQRPKPPNARCSEKASSLDLLSVVAASLSDRYGLDSSTGDAFVENRLLIVVLSIVIAVLVGCVAIFFVRRSSGRKPAEPPKPLVVKTQMDTEEDQGKKKVTVFFRTQTRTAEGFAKALAEEAKAWYPNAIFKVMDIDEYATEDDEYEENLKKESLALFFLATYGDGEPTDNAARFYKWFTEVAVVVDELLHEQVGLGDDDQCIEDDFSAWRELLWPELDKLLQDENETGASTPYTTAIPEYRVVFVKPEEVPYLDKSLSFANGHAIHDIQHPCRDNVAVRRELHTSASDRSCIHLEFDIDGTGLTTAISLIKGHISDTIAAEEVDFSGNGIIAAGLKALYGVLQTNTMLKTLNLSGNNIGDEGAKFTNLKYSRVEIDEVRFEWAECMLDYI